MEISHIYGANSSLSDPGTVYSDDVDTDTANLHSGDDFFICLRTNSTLAYGSKFRIHIPQNQILLTGAKYAVASHEVYSTLMTGNVFVKSESAGSAKMQVLLHRASQHL